MSSSSDEVDERREKDSRISLFCLDCVPVQIQFLALQHSSLLSPLQLQTNDEIYFSSHLDFDCHQSYSVIMAWQLFSCSMDQCSAPIILNDQIQTTSNELFLPSETLSAGLYQFEFTVIMVAQSNLTSSGSIYVNIARSIDAIIVRLMGDTPSMITIGKGQDLLLEPGKYSILLNGTTLNSEVSLPGLKMVIAVSISYRFEGLDLPVSMSRRRWAKVCFAPSECIVFNASNEWEPECISEDPSQFIVSEQNLFVVGFDETS